MAGQSESRQPARRQAGRDRRWALAWWAALWAGGVLGLQAEVRFEVFLGYDGIVPQASWCPVVCEIQNDGAPFVGTVVVEAEYADRGQSRQAVVELPTGTLKRLVIPVFSTAGGSGSWNVRLLDERGKVRSEQTGLRARRAVMPGTPLLGALVRTSAGVPVLRPILSPEGGLQPGAARLLADIFPDNPLVLEGLGALYVNSEAALGLKAGQVKALLAWLHGGGHLIVGVEQVSDITATPWLRAVLPCELNDFQTVPGHPELQAWLRSGGWPRRFAGIGRDQRRPPAPRRSEPPPGLDPDSPFSELAADPAFESASLQVATGRVRDGRVVVAASGGQRPLIVRANRGYGQVTLLMFSPEREPFRSWTNLPVLWARLAEVPGAWYVSADYRPSGGWSSDGIFGAMLDTRQVHKLPKEWLLALLLVYLVVIGPLDRYWLKRIGRPMLTWITFPCYVVLFSLLIYFIGYKLRAGESEWSELHVVDVLPRGEQAALRGRTYVSVYSPSNQRYWLECRQEHAALRGEFAGQWKPGQSGEQATFVQAGDGTVKAEIFVPVWLPQLYVSDWWEPALMPVTASVTRQGSGWKVRVENRTERALTNAHVVIGNLITALGAVPARESRTFNISRAQGKGLAEWVTQTGEKFQGAVQARQKLFGSRGSQWIDDLSHGAQAASFLSQLVRASDSSRYFITPPGLDLSGAAEDGAAVVLAWAEDYAPVKPMHQFKPRRSQRNTLWRVPTTVK